MLHTNARDQHVADSCDSMQAHTTHSTRPACDYSSKGRHTLPTPPNATCVCGWHARSVSCSCAQQAQATMCVLIDCKRIMPMNNAEGVNSGRNQVKAQHCVGKTRTHTHLHQGAIAHTGYGTHTKGEGASSSMCAEVTRGTNTPLASSCQQLTTTATPLLFVRLADAHQAMRTPRVRHGTATSTSPIWVSMQRRQHTCMGGDQCCGRGQTPQSQTTRRRLPAAVYTGGSRGSNGSGAYTLLWSQLGLRAHTRTLPAP